MTGPKKTPRPAMREPLAPPARAKATDATQPDGPWLEAGRGLGLYAAALSARLGLTVFLYLLMLLAVQTRAAGILTLASVVLSIATVTTGLVMLAGLARFARQPIGARSRSSARFAATVFGAAVLLELGGFFLLAMASAGDYSHAGLAPAGEASHDVGKLASQVGLWAAALAAVHVIAALVAIRSAALAIGKPTIARHIATVGALVAIGVAAALGLRIWLRVASAGDGRSLVLVMFVVMVAVAAIALYIHAAARLGVAMRTLGTTSTLPRSQTVTTQ